MSIRLRDKDRGQRRGPELRGGVTEVSKWGSRTSGTRFIERRTPLYRTIVPEAPLCGLFIVDLTELAMCMGRAWGHLSE